MDDILNRILECMGPQHGAGKELADHLGISPNVITNWKNGSNKSYRKYIKEISKKYNVSVDYLLGKEEQKQKAPANDGGRLSVEERVEQILDGMANEHSGTLMLDGKPASPEALDALRQAIKMGVEYARKINSEKK